MSDQERKDMVTLVGVKADGTEHVLGEATMPPKMKARELVQVYFGQFDGGDDDDSDGAMAYWAACELIDWMEKQGGVKVELTQPAALAQQAVPTPAVTHGWQSIETAPVDGSKVLLLWGDHENEICIGWYEERTSKTYLTPWRRDKWGLTETPYGAKPTHWMPLPTNSRPPVHPDGESQAAPQAEQQTGQAPAGRGADRPTYLLRLIDDLRRPLESMAASDLMALHKRAAEMLSLRYTLAAQQAAREPLAKRAILDLVPTTMQTANDIDLLWFARAVERAHRIGDPQLPAQAGQAPAVGAELTDAQIAAAWKAWPEISITSAAKAINFVRWLQASQPQAVGG